MLQLETLPPSETEAPFRCSVDICQHRVNIYSHMNDFVPYFEGYQDMQYRYDIPGWNISRRNSSTQPNIYYFPNPIVDFEHYPQTKQMVVRGPQVDFQDGQALAYISYWLSERERQQDRSFSLHSASVALEDKGTLLIGDKAAGKTTTMLALALRFKAQLMGNDLTVISHPHQETVKITQGTKRVRLRLQTARSHFPQLLDLFSDPNGSPNETKVSVDPNQLGISLATKPVTLQNAFIVRLSNDPSEKLRVQRVSGIQAFFELYENLSRIIRGSAISIFDSKGRIMGFLPSLENKATHQNKVDLLNHLIDERGIWSISGGNLLQLSDAIYNKATASQT